MQLTCGELHNLSELILSCFNSITNMALYKNEVTDSELKSILEQHLPVHIHHYNMKVKFVKEASAPNEKLNVPQLKKILQEVLIVLKHLIAIIVQMVRVLVITLMKTMLNNQ